MRKANSSTWKHQDNGRIKSRHRKNQGRRHRNRLQISGHSTKHAEQTKRGQTQSNNKVQKKLRHILKCSWMWELSVLIQAENRIF